MNRIGRSVLTVAVVAGLMTPWTLMQAYGDPGLGDGFVSYGLSANAPGLQVLEDRDGAQFHPEGEAEFPQALSALGVGPAPYALSSVAWPGQTFGNLGTLLLVASPQVPPQAGMLNDPVRAEARNGDGTVSNSSVPGSTMTATAQGALASAHTALPAVTSAALSVGSSDASSRASLSGRTSGEATATTALHDITIAGVVKLGSFLSTASASTTGSHATGSSSTQVLGLSVAGVPVTIDDTGVHVGPAQVPLSAQRTVTDALKRAGVTLLLTSPLKSISRGDADVTAGSLVVLWTPPGARGESLTLIFGGASVTAHAVLGTAFIPPSLPPLASGATPPGTGVAPVPGSVAPRTDAGSAPQIGTAGPGGATAPQVAVQPLAQGASYPRTQDLPVAWLVLGALGATGFGLAVLRRLPTREVQGLCPRATR